MTAQELYARNEKQILEHWFPNHAAQFTDITSTTEPSQKISSLTWRAPNSTCYYTRYIIDGRTLLVYGDIGDAVYGWSERLTWGFLAGLDLGYFAGKCCGSEHGRGYKTWDADVAENYLDRHFEEYPKDKGKWADTPGTLDAFGSKGEWIGFLHNHGHDVFGDDLSGMSGIGEVIDIRCQGHLIGIKLALAQLQKKYPQGTE